MTPSRAGHRRDCSQHLQPVWSLPDRSLVPTQPPASHRQAPSGASGVTRLTGPPTGSAQASNARGVRCWDPETQPGLVAPLPAGSWEQEERQGPGLPRALGKGMVVSGPQPRAGMVRVQTQTRPGRHTPAPSTGLAEGPVTHWSTPQPLTPHHPLAPDSSNTGCFGGSDHQKWSQKRGLA